MVKAKHTSKALNYTPPTCNTMPKRIQPTPLKPQPITLQPRETALIVVDMQNDFAEQKGSLYGEATATLIQPINQLIKKARNMETPVIFTQDWHLPNDIEFKLWPKHCVKGTWGAEITDQLVRQRDDTIVKKGTIDPWFKSTLDSKLKKTSIGTLIVTGTIANICVLHVIAGATIRGMRTVVPTDCIAPINPSDLDLAIHQFRQVYKSEITSSKALKLQNQITDSRRRVPQ